MNKSQEKQLNIATAYLSRAEQNNVPEALEPGYKMIKDLVEDIYKKRIDVPAVLQVEQVLNTGNANVLGNSAGAYDRMKELSGKTGFGLKQYEVMRQNPENYVAIADIMIAGIGSSPGEPRVAPESVPYDPARAALTQFRKELRKELTNRKIDKYPDNRQTNMMRCKATIGAERRYLEEYLAGRHTEQEEIKQKHLKDFDKRMDKLIREIEPPQQEKRPK